MLVKMMLTCENLLTFGKSLDRRPWPETRIFIVRVGISKVIAMRSKIVPGNFLLTDRQTDNNFIHSKYMLT